MVLSPASQLLREDRPELHALVYSQGADSSSHPKEASQTEGLTSSPRGPRSAPAQVLFAAQHARPTARACDLDTYAPAAVHLGHANAS